MRENNEYILLDYNFANRKNKLKVKLTYFKDIPKIDIREYYLDLSDNTYKHSKKGVQLDQKRAAALRAALEQNEKIIDKHLLGDEIKKWAEQIKTIETSADFFADFEFFKTLSSGSKEKIIFNNNHPFGKKIMNLESKIKDKELASELMTLLKTLLISYNHALSQFDEQAKTIIGDFIQDHHQTWSSLLKRMINSVK